nr:MAG TPA_asm: hypothetical protein [Caudoviricetes sp.]
MATDFVFKLVIHLLTCVFVYGGRRITFKTFGSNKNQTNSSDEL